MTVCFCVKYLYLELRIPNIHLELSAMPISSHNRSNFGSQLRGNQGGLGVTPVLQTIGDASARTPQTKKRLDEFLPRDPDVLLLTRNIR